MPSYIIKNDKFYEVADAPQSASPPPPPVIKKYNSLDEMRQKMDWREYNRLDNHARLRLLGVEPQNVDIKRVRLCFGKGSDAGEAMKLKKESPEAYRKFKLVAQTEGII